MPTTHELFLGKLDGSDRPVFFAARWFRLRKRYVTLPPINRAPTREDAPLYSGAFIIDPDTGQTRLATGDDDWLCANCEAEFEEQLNRD